MNIFLSLSKRLLLTQIIFSVSNKDPKTKQLEKIILVNGLQNHINSEEHKRNTPNKEKTKLEQAKETLNNFKTKDDQIKNEKSEEQVVSSYLNLIGFMLSEICHILRLRIL